VAGYAALAMVVAFFVMTGTQMLYSISSSGLEACLAQTGSDCADLAALWSSRYNALLYPLPLILVVPALFGMFWGAPLVARELEHGTHRLVWTQGVTRSRWITSKLAIILGSTVLASGLLALVMTWWTDPFVVSGRWIRLDYGVFDLQGIVPIAYSVFAVALGVALGALLRKTLPAMFATLAVFGVVRIAIMFFARKHYMAAKSNLVPFKAFKSGLPESGPHDWVLSSKIIDNAGRTVGGQFGLDPGTLAARCPDLIAPNKIPDQLDVAQCAKRIGLATSELYHPDERFWSFQSIEAVIFVALAALLIALVIWRVKRVS
jgi:ABC-type transport system involved in multi-copper enzyme maturation permease subunit